MIFSQSVHIKFTTLYTILGLILVSLFGCTGINDNNLALDPVFSEAARIHKSITLKRSEFLQLEKEYLLTLHPAHLRRMEELMKLLPVDLEIAAYLKKHNRYYRKGIDYERWKNAHQAFGLSRKTLCEMMLITGELQMLFGDKKEAIEIFYQVLQEFEQQEFQRYTAQAQHWLEELEQTNKLASAKQATPKDTN